MVKRILKIVAVVSHSSFFAYLTLVITGMYGMGRMPEQTTTVLHALVYTNVVLALVAIAVAFFSNPKLSFVLCGAQCLVFLGVFPIGTYLAPYEREKNLRANYKKINTRVIAEAELVLACAKGYRVAASGPRTTSLGKVIATAHLVPPDAEDEPLQILTSVDGVSGDVFVKHGYRHLRALLPSCKSEQLNFDELVARFKSM